MGDGRVEGDAWMKAIGQMPEKKTFVLGEKT